MAEDERRVRRTRRALRDALIGLILEQGYDRITVQQILDRADVVRSTFYAHYRDKESLLLSCFEDMLGQLRTMIEQTAPGAPLADPARPAQLLYEHASNNRRVFQALCGRQGGTQVIRHLHRLISDLLRDHLNAQLGPDNDLPADLIADFYANAMLDLLGWWIDRGFPHDAAWMARAFRTLAVPGLHNALSGGDGDGIR